MSLANDCLLKTNGPGEPYEFLCVYPHSTAPGHNLHLNVNSELDNGDAVYNASVLFKSFTFNPTYPVPVYQPAKITRPALNRMDPCLTLIKEKKAWEQHKETLLNSCHESMLADLGSNNEFLESSKVKVHPNVALLASHVQKDPDQHFNSSYNWYYSGSNIDIIDCGDKRYLMRPKGCTGELLFSPLILQHNEWKADTSVCDELMVTLRNSLPPCQVDVVRNFALVRDQTNCYYLTLKESREKIIVEQLFDISGSDDNPFISACVNKENINEFCTLSPDEEITVWNVSLSSAVSKLDLNIKESCSADSWGHVGYIDRSTILYADRQTVHICDLRANNNGKDSLKWSINKLVDICEEISCCYSGNRNINYIGTNHHLLSLDIRQGWMQRWTHGISSPASLIKIMQRNIQDDIFLASQRSDNVVFIQNDFEDETATISRQHPYTLPSLRESLHVARYHGLCLDHLLTSRFTMSLTGLCCFEDKSINIIRCTSIGDIFWQKLESSSYNNNSKRFTPKLSSDDIKKFEEFELKCEKDYVCSENKCRVTSLNKTTDIIDYLHETPSTSNVDKETKNTNLVIGNKLPHCKQLKTYCDYLAPMLLEAWDIDVLAEGSIDGDKAISTPNDASSSDEEYDIETAIINWLNTYSKEMTTNTEYAIDDEDVNVVNYDDPDEPSVNEESADESAMPKMETEINDSKNNVFKKSSPPILLDNSKSSLLEKNIAETNRGFTKRLISPKKPVSTTKKKYVAGF